MIAQYTQAAMVAENRRLAAPASVDSLPTSAMQEDHVSMGWGAARKLRAVVANLAPHPRRSSCCAPAHGLDLRAPLEPGAGDRRGARRAARRVAGPGPGPLPRARPRGGRGARRCRGALRAPPSNPPSEDLCA